MKHYTAPPVEFYLHDRLTKAELQPCRNGIVSMWIDDNYYDLSDPEIRKALMKNKPDSAEWVIIESANKKIHLTEKSK